MVKNSWPKRHGDICAIFLTDDSKNNKYNVYEQNETNGPWFEGSEFRKPDAYEQKLVDCHLFGYHHYAGGNGESDSKIICVAHNESELSDKIYKYAVEYCKKQAKCLKGKFINLTSRVIYKKSASD